LCNDRQRQEKIASLILYKAHGQVNLQDNIVVYRIAKHSFQFYTFTLKVVLEKVAIYLSLELRLCAVFVFHQHKMMHH